MNGKQNETINKSTSLDSNQTLIQRLINNYKSIKANGLLNDRKNSNEIKCTTSDNNISHEGLSVLMQVKSIFIIYLLRY